MIIVSILLLLVMLVLFLPKILNLLGLHPKYGAAKKFNLEGYKALIVTTSHDTLGDTGKKTGVYASEMTVPYYEFTDAKMVVDISSIKGGAIPIDPLSLKWFLRTPADKQFILDEELQNKVNNSLKIDDVDFTDYDLIYIAGGWGAAYDLGTTEILASKISEAITKDKILGSVCHGILGFVQAKDENGKPFLKNRRVTGVTNKQVRELRIDVTPLHPETEVKRIGAIFESKTARKDIFANHTVVDGNLVTGQNQNAGQEVAQEMMNILSKTK